MTVPEGVGRDRRVRASGSRADRRADPATVRSLRWFLTIGPALLGAAALAIGGRVAELPIVAAYAAVMAVSLRTSRGRRDLRPWLLVDGLAGIAAVVATGGADSPLLLTLLGPMLLSGMLRSVGVTAVLVVATAPALLVGTSAVQATSVFGVLVVAAIVGSYAERLLTPARRHDAVLDAAAAEHARIEQLTGLLDTLEEQLAGDQLSGSPRSRLLTLRRWLALVNEPDVIALRQGGGPEDPWQMLGADDEVRALSVAALPPALLRQGAGATDGLTLLPHIDTGTGVDPTSRRAAYLWLTREGVPDEVIALEWPLPRSFNGDEARFLTQLRHLFGLQRTAAERLTRLREQTAGSERFALAATLHDKLAQDLAYASMEAERAAKRYPDDADLAAALAVIRGAVTTVRSTITDLRRAAAPGEVRLEGGGVEVSGARDDDAGPSEPSGTTLG